MELLLSSSTKKAKFISSLISGIMFLFGGAGVLVIGSFSVYILSYIHEKDKWVDMQYGNLLTTIMTSSLALFSPLAGLLEKMGSPRISMLISGIIIEAGIILFQHQRNLWITYFLSLFIGMGCGLSFAVPVKNLCCYYPKRKGLISSLIMSVITFLGGGFLFLGEYLINPNKETVIVENNQSYYRIEIAERYKYYFYLLGAVIPITTFIAIFCFYKYDNNCEDKDTNKNISNQELVESGANSNENNKVDSNDSIAVKKELKKALTHSRFGKIL